MLLHVLAQGTGDVAVLRAGETPYLVSPGGKRSLAHDHLSMSAMRGLVTQLLPEAERDELATVGETRYELPTETELPDEHFVIDAELSPGGPVLEVRRLRMPAEDYVPSEIFTTASATLRTAGRDDTLSMPFASDLWHLPRAG